MASVNRVIILGNLGQDPELRYTPGGAPVCNFNVATSETWTDRDGNKQTTTEWHRIVVWNKQAENCAKYLAKGRTVYVEGRLQTRSWDDKTTGQKRYMTDVVAQNIQFMGGATARDNNSNQTYQSSSSGPAGAQSPSYAPAQNQNNQSQQYMPPMDDPFANDNFGGPSTPNLEEIPF